jgi:hypothetical protein
LKLSILSGTTSTKNRHISSTNDSALRAEGIGMRVEVVTVRGRKT